METQATQYRRICVTRNGYATVQADSDEAALAAAQNLGGHDFDWEEMRDILPDAEVIEVCDEHGMPIGTPDGTTVVCSEPNTEDERKAVELAGGYLLLPMSAYGAYLEGSEGEDKPTMYFAIIKDEIMNYLNAPVEDLSTVNQWLETFSEEEARALYDFAELDGPSDAVPFTWVPYAEEPLEIQCIESHSSMLALMDFLSGKLQENGFEDASKYLDAIFGI